MALTAGQVLNRARRSLNDFSAVRWTDEELLEYLSDAQRAAVEMRPEINPVVTVIQLVAGTLQSLPADGFTLHDVIRGMGVDGMTPGRAIRPIDRSTFDRDSPYWHSEAASIETRAFTYDTRVRKNFYVRPPQPAINPGQVEIAYSAIPSDLTDVADPLTLDDIYQPALLSYTLHRAHLKDVPEEGQNITRSGAYYTQFVDALMGAQRADERLHPLQQKELVENR